MKIVKNIYSIREVSKLCFYALKKNNGEEDAKKNFRVGVFLLFLPYYVMLYGTIFSFIPIIYGPLVININFLTKAIIGFILYAPFYFFIKKLVKKYSDFDMNEENYFDYTSKYSFSIIFLVHITICFVYFFLLAMTQNYFIHSHFDFF